ncbi:MAG: flavin reductase [Eubacterium sp.]|nr:flavin reductase [Eubacterium sp.]
MFKEIKITDLKENTVDPIKNQWALVTAGDKDSFNTMTVSWGSVGELWGRDVVTVYIRESRYTNEFVDNSDYFTLSVYPEELKGIHSVCGSKSGRDIDKAKECKLTPVFGENAPYFEEAKLVVICKKAAKSKFDKSQFTDGEIEEKWYSDNDYHYIYYGYIEKVLVRE